MEALVMVNIVGNGHDRRLEFEHCMRVFIFHITLIPWGKVCIQLLSLQQCVNSRAD